MRFIFYRIKNYWYVLRCIGYTIWYRELPNNTRNTDAGEVRGGSSTEAHSKSKPPRFILSGCPSTPLPSTMSSGSNGRSAQGTSTFISGASPRVVRSKCKSPVVLVQGVLSSWQAMKNLIDVLRGAGHRVFVVPSLGFNVLPIPQGARMVRECIERYDLRDVVVLGHSKGGLIGKYAMLFYNQDRRIKKLVTLATPFAGSRSARLVPGSVFDELKPESAIIKELSKRKEVNGAIVSIFGAFDTAIFPLESARLDGAKNIQVGSHGHFEILFHPEVRKQIFMELSQSGQL